MDSLTCQSLLAVSMFFDLPADRAIFMLSKYSPVVLATSGEEARYMEVSAPVSTFFAAILTNIFANKFVFLDNSVEIKPG